MLLPAPQCKLKPKLDPRLNHYAEASSYGSQSASSFAALYSKYVTDDVTVAVRRTSTEDSSIHVSRSHILKLNLCLNLTKSNYLNKVLSW